MTSVTDIRSAIAAELGKTVILANAKALETTKCQYCNTELTMSELKALAETGDPDECMCDKCAEQVQDMTAADEARTAAGGQSAAIAHAATAVANASRIRELELQIEIEKAKAEHAKLTAAVGSGKKPASQPEKSGTLPVAAAGLGKTPAPKGIDIPDTLLVEIVKALRMPVATTGKYAGDAKTPTVAKLVYATLYAYVGNDPVSKALVAQCIDSAVERRILSRRFSVKCMLLWDYTEMPNPDNPNRSKALPTDLASKLSLLFAKK